MAATKKTTKASTKKAAPVAAKKQRNVPQAANEWPRIKIWKGVRHTLAKADGGYTVDGKKTVHATLSGAAKSITEGAVNGNVFWGFGTASGPKTKEQRAASVVVVKPTGAAKREAKGLPPIKAKKPAAVAAKKATGGRTSTRAR